MCLRLRIINYFKISSMQTFEKIQGKSQEALLPDYSF